MGISNLARSWRDALRALGRVTVLSALVALTPVPASRPRVSKWGTYYAKTYSNWMKDAAARLAKESPAKFDAPCVAFVEQLLPRPKASKFDTPSGDIDNLVKAPLDAITKAGVAWQDDRQVVGLVAFKRFVEPGEEPGTRVEYVQLQGAT